MSDESTNAASTLLSSLLAATTAVAVQPSAQLDKHDQISLGENLSAFEQILSSNIDADVDSLAANDLPTNPTQTRLTGAAAGQQHQEPLELFGHQVSNHPQLALSAHQSPLESSGNRLPGAGEILPVTPTSNISELSWSEFLFAESDRVHNQKNPFSNSEIDINTENDEAQGDSRLQGTTLGTESVAGSPAAPALNATSPATPITTEQTGVRSNDYLSSAGTTNEITESSKLTADTSADQSQDFEQSNSQDQSLRDLAAEAKANRSVTAEFAADTKGANELLQATSTISNLTAEPGTTPLGSLTQTQLQLLTNATSAAAPLSLATDRNIAGAQIAQTLSSFVRQGDDYAEINLSPPHLGKISVRILLQNDQASVILSAPTADVREAIEASLPRLSDLLSEAGLTLADANVSDQDNYGNSTTNFARSSNNGSQTDTAPEQPIETHIPLHTGLLDAYA